MTRLTRWLSLALVTLLTLCLPRTLFAQADAAPALTPLGTILLLLQPGITGWLSTVIYDGLKTLVGWYDRLGATVHAIAAPVLAFLLGAAAAALGIAPVESLTDINGPWLDAALTVLAQQGIFRYLKPRSPADATEVVAS